METIKNYLESMFRGLPQTEKILKAKSELLQMMEDKYTELIRSGKTENEAVGDVIQNFGNLEDLSDELGIKEILYETKYAEIQRRKLSFEEVTEYISQKTKAIVFRSVGIMLCIIAVTCFILGKAFDIDKIFCTIGFFVCIGTGVVFMILASSFMENWNYMKTEPCSIDAVSVDYLKNKLRDFTPTYSVLSSVGILLCILCFTPSIVLDEFGGRIGDELGGAMLFYFVGAGVFMMTFAKSVRKTYLKLLNINEKTDFEEERKNSFERVSNPTVRAIMSAYWSIVTCIYLSVSFLTFCWHITWLIWPVAAAVRTIIVAIYSTNDEKSEGK